MIQLAAAHPDLTLELSQQRPLLSQIPAGRETLEIALDSERRSLAHADEKRLHKYALAAQDWTHNWPALKREIAGLPLRQAHQIVVRQAQMLPQEVF